MRLRTAPIVALVIAWVAAFSSPALAQFEARWSTLVNHISVSVVVGDFNGDGVLDLAEVNNTPTTGEVQILLGNGDGTFRPGGSYIFGIFPLFGAAASLRNNGILDLVINDKLNDEVWVLLGNGDGTFQPAVGYPTTAESYMVANRGLHRGRQPRHYRDRGVQRPGNRRLQLRGGLAGQWGWDVRSADYYDAALRANGLQIHAGRF